MTPTNSHPLIYKDKTKTLKKNNNKIACKSLRQYALKIKIKIKTDINKIAFNTGTHILNIFNN